MDRPEILEFLREQLDRAQMHREAASCEFDEAMKAMPRGGGSADDVKRLREASRQYSAALEELSRALRQKTEYLLHGTEPLHKTMSQENASQQTSTQQKGPDR